MRLYRGISDENEIIKKGEVPEEWKEKSAKIAQKDVDARWGSNIACQRSAIKRMQP